MSRLSWVQPADLLAHELVAAVADGKRVEDVRERWLAAGGSTEAPLSGTGPEVSEDLGRLAAQLLDELDARPVADDVVDVEPDDLAAIEATWPAAPPTTATGDDLADRVLGAWQGRAAGCLLGKPVEKIPREGIREILESQGRWPLDDWFTAVGLPDEVARRWPWNRRSAPNSLAENIRGMPEDDDLNFAVLALGLLERHGDAFTTEDVADAWLADLPGGRVFTAERVAYRNLLLGHLPPATAVRHNPFREWIGAQIRADAYGWARPGDPAAAARLAHRDARLSHVRNGVYGAMFVAAACAQAVVDDDVERVVEAGLSVVPSRSRYAEAVAHGVEAAASSRSDEEAIDAVVARYGTLHWVHVLNNASLVALALLRGGGDLARSITLVVSGGWDTDSNGATVGSLCGALTGARGLPARWVDPLRDRVATSLPGPEHVALSELAARTVAVAAR